jgi:hypothetical protein
MVGLPRAFGEVFDLVVLDADLLAQKITLAFEAVNDGAALKVAFGAIPLNAAGRTGETSASVALDGLLDGESYKCFGTRNILFPTSVRSSLDM